LVYMQYDMIYNNHTSTITISVVSLSDQGCSKRSRYDTGARLTPSNILVVSLSKALYPQCLVLVGSRNGFKLEFTIKLT